MPPQEINLSVIGRKLEIVVLHAVPSVDDMDDLMLPAVHGKGQGSLIGLVTRVGGDFDLLGEVVPFHGSFFLEPKRIAREASRVRPSNLVEKILKLFDHRDLDLR